MPSFPNRRYAASLDAPLPDLGSQDFVDSVDTTTEVTDDTLYDTSNLHLERAGIELYRRKGSNGTAWQLKLSEGADSEILTFESRATTPPREVSTLLLAIRGGQRLRVTERILRERDGHLLLDPDGGIVAILEDTRLTRSHPQGEFETELWREIEVGRGPSGTKSSRKAVHRLLASADATEISHSRLETPKVASSQEPGRKKLGGLVDVYLQTQLLALALGDLDLRRAGDSVHATRIAIRRLRSTLHVFADLFDETKAKRLSDELSWFAGLLGQARDADIAGARVEKLLDTAPASLEVESARKHVNSRLGSDKKAARDAIVDGMSGRRYQALVATLEEWRVDPPYLDAASQSRGAAGTYVARTQKKLHRRLRACAKQDAGVDELHRARKVAKRLRYAAELAGSSLPKGGQAMRKEGRDWQLALGEVQDGRIASDLLSALGSSAPTKDDSFVFGVLWDSQQRASDRAYASIIRKVR